MPPGRSSSVTFSSGVASVSVTFKTGGTQSITARDSTRPALTGSASTQVSTVTATRLVFTVQPGTTAAGQAFSPALKVTLVDSAGNPVTTGTSNVTLTVGSNPSGGVLSGTTTVAASGGVATFSNVALDKVGAGYTLTASATGLTSATSNPFQITPGAAAKLVFSTQPTTGTAGGALAAALLWHRRRRRRRRRSHCRHGRHHQRPRQEEQQQVDGAEPAGSARPRGHGDMAVL